MTPDRHILARCGVLRVKEFAPVEPAADFAAIEPRRYEGECTRCNAVLWSDDERPVRWLCARCAPEVNSP